MTRRFFTSFNILGREIFANSKTALNTQSILPIHPQSPKTNCRHIYLRHPSLLGRCGTLLGKTPFELELKRLKREPSKKRCAARKETSCARVKSSEFLLRSWKND